MFSFQLLISTCPKPFALHYRQTEKGLTFTYGVCNDTRTQSQLFCKKLCSGTDREKQLNKKILNLKEQALTCTCVIKAFQFGKLRVASISKLSSEGIGWFARFQLRVGQPSFYPFHQSKFNKLSDRSNMRESSPVSINVYGNAFDRSDLIAALELLPGSLMFKHTGLRPFKEKYGT